IYNIDETGIYYRMQPNQTLSSTPVLAQDKKILLLVNNAPSHFDLHEDEQDNNTDDYNNFGEQNTSSSTFCLHKNFYK
ncbi:6705_t:CDS:2, partial [Racocetra fulgida]